MEYIIHQIAQDFIKSVTKKVLSDKIYDVDSLACDIELDCKAVTRHIIEAVAEEINLQIRKDKSGRKKAGLVIKEKERPRHLYTKLGVLNLKRDYFYDKTNNCYTFPLDHMVGIRAYERIGDTVSAEMVNNAAHFSYAKSTHLTTGGAISRQSVCNHIIKVGLPEEKIPTETKEVKALYVYADEDHVHMQKPNKERGKKSQIMPMVTVTEGIRKVGKRRNETIGAKHFVDKNMDSRKLWKKDSGYISATYDIEKIEHIYVYGDGGRWIKKGLEEYIQTEHVMDGYHFGKRLKYMANAFPKRNVKTVIRNAIKENNRKKADSFLQSLMSELGAESRDKVLDFGTYLMGNWEEIYRLETYNIPGSCTEGQVSHVLSERFSRNPMGWSKEGLGKLGCIRASKLNGRKIETDDFKRTEIKSGYAEYADKLIEDVKKGAKDWSIFDGEPQIFDRTSGTQVLINAYGTNHGILMS